MIVNGTTYKDGTHPQVVNVLEAARANGTRLRIWYGDAKTGRSWEEEWDVVGTVGRSGGTIKIPLLIKNKSSLGGGGILTDCIVKVMDTRAKRTLYVHPKFNQPEYSVGWGKLADVPAEVWDVTKKEVVARFKNMQAAYRWIEFMYGTAMSKGGGYAKQAR